MSLNNPFDKPKKANPLSEQAFKDQDRDEGTARHAETIRPEVFNIRLPANHAYADKKQIWEHLLPSLRVSGASVAFDGNVRETSDGSRVFTLRLEGTYNQIAAAAQIVNNHSDLCLE